MARFRATTNYQRRVEATGKRTGVNIHSQDIPVQDNGFEDPDAFFTQPVTQPTEKENPVARPKFTRFSLGSLHQDDSSSSASSSGGATKRMMGRAKGSTSPSELSRVSTASASPVRKKAAEESPLPTMEEDTNVNDDEVDDEEEEEVTRQSAAERHDPEESKMDETGPARKSRDDDTINDASVMGSVMEDDFMPPGPPDSPERDDESEMPTQMSHSIDFPSASADEESEGEEDVDAGPGYSMPSTQTPQSAKLVREEKTKPKKGGKKRKKVQVVESSDEESEEPKKKKKTKPAATKKSKYGSIFSPKGIPLPLEYETLPVDTFRQMDDGTTNGKACRRSKRARCKPLAFWKNEKLQYGPNEDMDLTADIANMPVPKAVIKAKDTPYKPRAPAPTWFPKMARKRPRRLRPRPTIPSRMPHPWPLTAANSAKSISTWTTRKLCYGRIRPKTTQEMKVVAYNDRVQYHKLPLGKDRAKAEGNVVGKAAQAFSFTQPHESEYVGYIMGNLTLPPKGIKDAESVGSCAQTFTVVSGQPGAVEVAYADPDEDDNGTLKPESAIRFLLGPGDMFRVPPGNCYRLQNHSKTTECFMTWTIIRPHVGG